MTEASAHLPPDEAAIEKAARRARRLIFAAAFSLFAIALLGVLLGIDTWPDSVNALRDGLAHRLPDTGSLLVVVPAAGLAARCWCCGSRAAWTRATPLT